MTRQACAAWLLVLSACGPSTMTGSDGGDAAIDGGPRGDADTTCVDAECDDGVFCNGVESCVDGACAAADNPCAADETCDEATDSCRGACDAIDDADGDGARSMACGGNDCDDDDPGRYPGNTEICETGDRDEDCDPVTFGFRDSDGDGFPDARCCNDEGARTCGTDCDDSAPTIHPTASEVCDERDSDCDSNVDEGAQRTFLPDMDGDGYGDPTGTPMMACFPPADFVEQGGDCNDDPTTGSMIHPGAADDCDIAMVDENCDGTPNNPPGGCLCTGAETRPCTRPGLCASGQEACDGGTFGMCSIAPVPEICDGLDQDCDNVPDNGTTVVCFADDDNDGYAAAGAATSAVCPDSTRPEVGECPAGRTDRAPLGMVIDCADLDPTRSPGTPEICNLVDEDCDGLIDDGVTITCYVDVDGDGYARAGAAAQQLCADAGRPAFGGCPVGTTNLVPTVDPDCNDTSASVSPAAPEVCDSVGVDEDCDGVVNDGVTVNCYADADGDTYAPSGSAQLRLCPDSARTAVGQCPVGYTNRMPGVIGTVDCDDLSAATSPAASETCNNVDDNCNGTRDEGATVQCYADGDGDTYAAAGTSMQDRCPDPARTSVGQCPVGFTNRQPSVMGTFDCNDLAGTVSPAASETCNTVDDDCDGTTDDGVTVACYLDGDGDGYSPASATQTAQCPDTSRPTFGNCPVGYTNRSPGMGADCDDLRGDTRPGIAESRCDGLDDNCNGTPDETVQTRYYRDADNDTYGNSAVSMLACTAPSGYVPNSTDCNDGVQSIHPTAAEVCDCVDQDCNMLVDDMLSMFCVFRDADGDEHGDVTAPVCETMLCIPPAGQPVCHPSYAATRDDCNDAVASIHPGASEICGNGIDDDCANGIDDSAPTWYEDLDNDTYGNNFVTVVQCSPPATGIWRTIGGDCDPMRGYVFPGAPEQCDGLDTDCTTVAGPGEVVNTAGLNHPQEDNDGDGRGDNACPTPPAMPFLNDCNDLDAQTFTGAPEVVANGVDNDCNGMEICFIDGDSDGWSRMDGATTVSADPDCDDSGEGRLDELRTDCADADANISPGDLDSSAMYIGNNVDNDCDGRETCYLDGDNDGFSRSDGMTLVSGDPDCMDNGEGLASEPRTDCNDIDANVSPGDPDTGTNIGNNVDNDCNGQEVCYADSDGDAHRTTSTTTSSDSDCSDAGEAAASVPSDDCDDSTNQRYPGNADNVSGGANTGNGVDNDCNNTEICYVDMDSDSHRRMGGIACTTNAQCTASEVCASGACHATVSSTDVDCADSMEGASSEAADDCADTDPARYPGNADDLSGGANTGNGVDNDCNNVEICWADVDDDGHRPTGVIPCTSNVQCSVGQVCSLNFCQTTNGSVDVDCADNDEALSNEPTDDCADNDATRYPGNFDNTSGGANTGNGVDNDCNGQEICFNDADGDSHRPPGGTTCTTNVNCLSGQVCSAGQCHGTITSSDADCFDAAEGAASEPADDCADTNASRYPGNTDLSATNIANGVDNDCNTQEICFNDGDDDNYRPVPSVTCTGTCAGTQVCVSGFCRPTRVSTDFDCVDNNELGGSDPVTDCCDSDANARPTQTAYFTTSRVGCGGYDYNCDSMIDPLYVLNRTDCTPCTGQGWSTTSDPACGVLGSWRSCVIDNEFLICDEFVDPLTQACR